MVWGCASCGATARKAFDKKNWTKYGTPAQEEAVRMACEWKAWGGEQQEKNPFVCGCCSKRFPTEYGRDSHLETCGVTEDDQKKNYAAWLKKKKPYECKHCEKRFGTEQGKEAHEEICTAGDRASSSTSSGPSTRCLSDMD